jgi:hypothetical protein
LKDVHLDVSDMYMRFGSFYAQITNN